MKKEMAIFRYRIHYILFSLVLLLLPLMSVKKAKADDDKVVYFDAGKFIGYNEEEDYYYFYPMYCNGNVPNENRKKEWIEFEGLYCYPIRVEKSLFEKTFSMDTMYTISFTDYDDEIYEITDDDGPLRYFIWCDLNEEFVDFIYGYFETECGSIEAHPEIFNDVYVYKFKLLESSGYYSSDYIYIECEKDEFDKMLDFDSGYYFDLFDTGESYKGEHVYSLYDYKALRYDWGFNDSYDDTRFQKFDKQELIDKYKQEKKEQAKKDFKPFFIIVGAILAIGTVNIVIVKKKHNKNRNDEYKEKRENLLK